MHMAGWSQIYEVKVTIEGTEMLYKILGDEVKVTYPKGLRSRWISVEIGAT